MHIKQIDYAELNEAQMAEVGTLSNETLPQGQDLFLKGSEIIAVERHLRELFEAQNREAIEKDEIAEII